MKSGYKPGDLIESYGKFSYTFTSSILMKKQPSRDFQSDCNIDEWCFGIVVSHTPHPDMWDIVYVIAPNKIGWSLDIGSIE